MIAHRDAGDRLGQEVGSSLDACLSHIENSCFGPYGRRIRCGGRSGISDVIRSDVQMLESKRPVRIRIHVNGVTVVNREVVDLEGVDAFYGVLPSLFAQWHLVGVLSTQLYKIDMQPRMKERQVCHDVPGEQVAPLYLQGEDWKVCDG